jgi:hypothetical protein
LISKAESRCDSRFRRNEILVSPAVLRLPRVPAVLHRQDRPDVRAGKMRTQGIGVGPALLPLPACRRPVSPLLPADSTVYRQINRNYDRISSVELQSKDQFPSASRFSVGEATDRAARVSTPGTYTTSAEPANASDWAQDWLNT